MTIEITKKKPSISRSFRCLFFALSFFFMFVNAAFAANDQTGETFLVEKDYDYLGRSQAAALLIYESKDADFYYDKDYYNTMTFQEQESVKRLIGKLGEEFDSVIYPYTKDIFGDEWNPGIDDSEKVTVLFLRMNYGVGGYFNANDEYAKNEIVDNRSNEREMIYLNTNYLNQLKTEGFLGHEFQHMIYWNEKTHIKGLTDDIWINEGRSELAASMVENSLGKKFSDGTLALRKRDFLQGYIDSLTDWNNLNYDYASVSVFMQYLKEQAGTGIFQQMNNTRRTGAMNLDYILKREKGVDLSGVFTDWTIANYINDVNFNSRYGYRSENFSKNFNVVPSAIYDKNGDDEINLTGTLKNWSADYYKVDLNKKNYSNLYLEINFNGDNPGVFLLPIVINYKDGSKKVDFINMDDKQDGHKEIVSLNGDISSIVFIPSSQKLDEALEGNQAQSHPFALDVKLTPIVQKILPDESLIKADDDGKIYLVEGFHKRWITDSATFMEKGYDWGKVVTVSETELGIYGEGEAISGAGSPVQEGSLIKGANSKVYLIENGKRRWIGDEETFTSFGFDWSKVIQVSNQELFKYAEGETLAKKSLTEGALIRGANEKVYFLRSGKKCWVVTPEAFSKNNFSWSSVIGISEEIISSYENGPNID